MDWCIKGKYDDIRLNIEISFYSIFLLFSFSGEWDRNVLLKKAYQVISKTKKELNEILKPQINAIQRTCSPRLHRR